MTRSVYELPASLQNSGDVAEGHSADGKALPGGWREIPELAAGGLWSTPIDLAHFLISLAKSYRGEVGGFLSPPIARSMTTAVMSVLIAWEPRLKAPAPISCW
jgi:CubicO group peptidase (beta-lactamase class C family)